MVTITTMKTGMMTGAMMEILSMTEYKDRITKTDVTDTTKT